METLVMKFGGSSVAKIENFLQIAGIILQKAQSYQKIVVVTSAMGDTTNNLIALAKKIHPTPPKREQDMLISVGERVSTALLAMALYKKGKEAVSFTGSQSGIITSEDHAEAKILDVKPTRILNHLAKGQIVIVAGFQGVSTAKEITTLGRGGSDTSAVALAVGLKAKVVEFYKDVDGFYDDDPKKNKQAKRFVALDYDKAICLAQSGAKVLSTRAIVMAKRNHIQLVIRSFRDSFSQKEKGTVIGNLQEPVDKCYYEECLA